RARLDRHAERAGAHLVGIAIGAAGADIELPAVPWTAQHLAGPRRDERAGPLRFKQRRAPSLAQRPALMRTAVGKCEIFAVEIEDRNLAAGDGRRLAAVRRNVADPGDDVA